MKENHLSDWKLFLYFIRFLTPVWDKVLLVLFLAVMITIIDINTIIMPLISRKFIDNVLGQQDWQMLKILTVIIICQIVLYLTTNTLLELLKYGVSLKLGIHLGMTVFKHALSLPLSFFQQRPVGEHIYRIGTTFDPGLANLTPLGLLFETTGSAKGESQPIVGNDVDTVLTMITQSLDLILRITVRLLLILFAVSYGISKSIAIALVLFCIPYIGAIHLLYNLQRRIDLQYRIQSQTFIAGLQEWFAGIKTTKAFGKGKYAVLINISRYIKMLRVQWRNYFVKLITDNVIQFFRYAFIVSAILYLLMVQNISAGTVVALYLLLEQFFSPITMYIRVIEGIRLQLIPARRLMETLGQISPIVEKEPIEAMNTFSGSYRIADLSFGYVPEKEILSHITFAISKGHRVGIVGLSGSGKSTLVNLLMRFYDPNGGDIFADNINLKQLKLNRYYRNIGIVLQEDFLFNGTVSNNIRYGKPNASDEEVIASAKWASVHEDILHLPEGYDTDVSEGTKLSGGQRQRIAIARA